MFEPGHLHRASFPGQTSFSVDVYYDVRHDPAEGAMLHFRMEGEIAGKAFKDEFELHRDTAFNFPSALSRVASKHGLPTNHSLVMRGHDEFDRMFKDIRTKLDAKPGEAVSFDHLDKDGL